MEIEMRSSRYDFTNGDISSSKHGNAENIFNRYVRSIDTDQRNGQMLNQLSGIQSLLQDIKVGVLLTMHFKIMAIFSKQSKFKTKCAPHVAGLVLHFYVAGFMKGIFLNKFSRI